MHRRDRPPHPHEHALLAQGISLLPWARVTHAAGTAEYRILDARTKQAVVLDAKADLEAKADRLAREFPAGSWFEIYDDGVGDEVVWPHTASLTRKPSGPYRVRSPVPVTMDSRDPHGPGGVETPRHLFGVE